MAVEGETEVDGQTFAAEAFRRLYPEQYFRRFIDDGIRPDGRTLGRARATTISVGSITVADGSALIRLGSTIVLAGVRYGMQRPSEDAPDRGALALNVEIAPFSSADWRPGKAPELVSHVSERLLEIMAGPQSPLDLKQLCICKGKACWLADMTLYILNSNGGVMDAALLATIAALSSSLLPAVHLPKNPQDGDIRAIGRDSVEQPNCPEGESRPLKLTHIPLALTCGTYGEHLLVDPTSEEESLSSSCITVVLDDKSRLHGLYKAGGAAAAAPQLITRCVESAKLRYQELVELLKQALSS